MAGLLDQFESLRGERMEMLVESIKFLFVCGPRSDALSLCEVASRMKMMQKNAKGAADIKTACMV